MERRYCEFVSVKTGPETVWEVYMVLMMGKPEIARLAPGSLPE